MVEEYENNCTDWVFLKEHPLVRFVDYPLSMVHITDGINLRSRTVGVRSCQIDLVSRLKKEEKIRNRMFVVYPFNKDTEQIYGITYNHMDFSEVKTIKFAEIEITKEEWDFMMKQKIREREENYKKSLEKERRANTNYKYLLIRR